MHEILVIRLYSLLYAGTSGFCMAIATPQPDVWYRHTPNAMYSL